MIRKRIKKNLGITLHVLTNGEVLPLEGRNLRVERCDPYGKKAQIRDFTVENDAVKFVFRADEQTKLGIWKFIVWENCGLDGQTGVDFERAIQLVASTDQETPGAYEPGLDIESLDLGCAGIEVGGQGPQGPAGPEYDDSALRQLISTKSDKEYVDAELGKKQDTIPDLATIRSGAAAGSSAVQPSAISDMETKEHAQQTYQPKGSYASPRDVEAKYTKPSGGIPETDLSEDVKEKLNRGSGGSTPIYDGLDSDSTTDALSAKQGKMLKGLVDGKGTYSKPSTGIPASDLAAAVRTSLGKADTALQTHQDISGKADKSYVDAELGKKQDTISDLATIRSNAANGNTAYGYFSGGKLPYSLLSGTPTIPAAVTEQTVSGWGFTKNTGTYSKPSGGIPKSDLSTDVQTTLNKVDELYTDYSTALNLI